MSSIWSCHQGSGYQVTSSNPSSASWKLCGCKLLSISGQKFLICGKEAREEGLRELCEITTVNLILPAIHHTVPPPDHLNFHSFTSCLMRPTVPLPVSKTQVVTRNVLEGAGSPSGDPDDSGLSFHRTFSSSHTTFVSSFPLGIFLAGCLLLSWEACSDLLGFC